MRRKTINEIFVEWLDAATIEELQEELLKLREANLRIASQLEDRKLRSKVEGTSIEYKEWKIRAIHAQRFGRSQIKSIKEALRDHETEALLKSAELKLIASRLHNETVAQNRKHKDEKATRYDVLWIQAAKDFLDTETFKKITALVDSRN